MAKTYWLAMGMGCMLLVFPASSKRVEVNENPSPFQAGPGTGSAQGAKAFHPLLVLAWRERLAWWRGEKFFEPLEMQAVVPGEHLVDSKGKSFCDERKLGIPCDSFPKTDVVDFRSLGVVPRKKVKPAIFGTITIDDLLIPGVKVSLEGNKNRQETFSNEYGLYRFDNLKSGIYSLKMERDRFDTKMIHSIDYHENNQLEISQKMRLDGQVFTTPAPNPRPVIIDVKQKKDQSCQEHNKIDPETVEPLLPWRSTEPYLGEDQAGLRQDSDKVYLRQREHYRRAPAFFLAWADYFIKLKQEHKALRVLDDFAEVAAGNSLLLRVLGYRLQRLGKTEKSAGVFIEVLRLRPGDSQSCRDLALAMTALKKYDRAARLFQNILTNPSSPCWNRLLGIEIISLLEWNMTTVQAKNSLKKILAPPPELRGRLDLDLRVVLDWDAPGVDADLVVEEPSGQQADYSLCRSGIGAITSADASYYGPEEYLLRKAAPGKYKIYARCFTPANSNALPLVPATLQANIFTNFGRANEKKLTITHEFAYDGRTVFLGEIEF